MNKVFLFGNLGAEPEYKELKKGGVLRLRLATNERYKSGEEWVEKTEWHRVSLFGERGEKLAEFLKKGDKVLIEARLSYSQYEGEDGETKYSTDIIATNLHLCGKAPSKGGKPKKERDEGDYPEEWDEEDDKPRRAAKPVKSTKPVKKPVRR